MCIFFIRLMIKWASWARLATSSNNFFSKEKWLDSTCFFIVVVPLNLWYAMRPFLHLVHMAMILGGVVSL